MKTPTVSVIITNYNRADLLEQALQSVLEQTYQDFEIVVFDDGSRDHSLQIMETFREERPEQVRVFTHEGGVNRGIVATYFEAISRSRGELVAFLEHDDCWSSEFLKTKVEIMQTDRGIGVVFSRYRVIADGWFGKDMILRQWLQHLTFRAGRPFDNFGKLLQSNNVATFSCFMTRRKLLEGIPRPPENILALDWWILTLLSRSSLFYFDGHGITHWRWTRDSAIGRQTFWQHRESGCHFMELMYAQVIAGAADLSADKQKVLKSRHEDFVFFADYYRYPNAGSLWKFLRRAPVWALASTVSLVINFLKFRKNAPPNQAPWFHIDKMAVKDIRHWIPDLLRPPLSGQVWNDPVKLFVHIPKTAGTSLRMAAELCFGGNHVLGDYGPESFATSSSVLRLVYRADRPDGIDAAIESDRARLVCGHFPVQKYGQGVGLRNTATIFRNPVDQVISHYRHRVVLQGYEGSLSEFAHRKDARDIQASFVSGLDPALFGLVGLTERYCDTLELINGFWQWRLKHRRTNVSDRWDRDGVEVSEQEREVIAELNRQDLALYRRARLVFENSLHCFRQKFASDPRGALDSIKPGEPVRGWAFDMQSDKILHIGLLCNGELLARAAGERPVSRLIPWQIPRGGNVGFELNLVVNSGDRLELVDTATNLVLDRQIAG